jgi:hypothetical protein
MSALNDIIEMAASLAEDLHSDVRLASTRLEHIRVTARANEAVNLLYALQSLTEETNDIPKADG